MEQHMTLKLNSRTILTYGYDPTVKSCNSKAPALSYRQIVVKGLYLGLVRIHVNG